MSTGQIIQYHDPYPGGIRNRAVVGVTECQGVWSQTVATEPLQIPVPILPNHTHLHQWTGSIRATRNVKLGRDIQKGHAEHAS